jgi:hypothetical protein
MPINVLPAHVAEALAAEDCATPSEGFLEALEQNSGLSEEDFTDLTNELGSLD